MGMTESTQHVSYVSYVTHDIEMRFLSRRNTTNARTVSVSGKCIVKATCLVYQYILLMV